MSEKYSHLRSGAHYNNKSTDFDVTQQAPFNLSLSRVVVFRTDERTDTMCEKYDHIFGRRGLVGQKHTRHLYHQRSTQPDPQVRQ